MTAGASVLYLTALADDREIASPSLPWWALALAFLVSESFPAHLHFRSETHTLSLSELAMVVGLFFMTPGALLLAVVIGSGAAFVCVRRQRALKSAFNIAQFGLSVAVSIAVFRSTLTLGSALGPAGWAAAVAAAATFGILSVTLVATTISLATGTPLNGLPKTVGLALAGSHVT